MSGAVHLLLKFKNQIITLNGKQSDTVTEHEMVCTSQNRLIWGQSSKKRISGVSKLNRNRYKDQISRGIQTYVFFVTKVRGEQEVFMGEMCNIYGVGEIENDSSLIKYIPNYYSGNVGTENDTNNLFVEVKTFIKLNPSILNYIIIESSKTRSCITEHKSSTPVFQVLISNDVENYLLDYTKEHTFKNNYQNDTFDKNIDEGKEYPEGSVSYKVHRKLERNPEVIRDAKALFKKRNGSLFCETCKIDFSVVYGERGQDFIEGHHKKLVSEMKDGEATKVEDIAMLCSNCHRMIHRKPMISVEELEKIIAINRQIKVVD
ncbi:HNH endonuclease [Paenibacillus sp. MER TA 81-3]|uniref:HNH endonuclease n=1 Tax=Paenibacillus sp. MER TA 81-3 TaxID=2939573 RepID=UPI00203C8BFE|nr:HNH endonuclease [Paenibacillus sp. MER TA 81-3]MCM3342011.1 HNH endonuclease [Paenibacillus sp. MER TA 81-3]